VSAHEERIAALEAAVTELRHELELLKARFDAGTDP
jgi:outer membrane protein TolC